MYSRALSNCFHSVECDLHGDKKTLVENLSGLPVDELSRKGYFDRIQLGDHMLPFIYRHSQNVLERYCSVHMFRFRMQKFFDYLNPKVFLELEGIPSYYMTGPEVKFFKTLNEICAFSGYTYTEQDILISLEDTIEFYNYLNVCYQKLASDGQMHSEICGFNTLAGKAPVPYVMHNEAPVVPLALVEYEIPNMHHLAFRVTGWTAIYFKFLLKLLGLCTVNCPDGLFVIPLALLVSEGSKVINSWPSDKVVYKFLDESLENLRLLQTYFSQPPKRVLPEMKD